MNSKAAMLAMALVLAVAFVSVPMDDASAIYEEGVEYDDSEMHILLDSGNPSVAENEHVYLYDLFLVIIIVLAIAGALHVKARGMDIIPKKKE